MAVPIALKVPTLTSETVPSPVFATTAIPSALSMATAEGLKPTAPDVALAAGGMAGGTGVTARFRADSDGRPGARPEFVTTMGYRPGVVRSPLGIASDSRRLPLTVAVTDWPLNVAVVVLGEKNPPVSSTVGVDTALCGRLDGKALTTTG